MSALFISDLHIDESRPSVLAGLERLVDTDTRDVDMLVILGDLVEVWVGDDDDGAVADAVRGVLSTAAERCPVFVMHGNRDFLLGERFAADTGVTLLDDPATIDIDGQPVFTAHGDAYCTRDTAYQRMRATFRSPTWQSTVLASSLDERRSLAASLRAQSMAANENKADNIMDVTPEAVEDALDQAGAELMVHGHTHRPGIHDLGGGRRRVVLGDWDRCGWKFRIDQGDLALSCFPLP
ncbi:MAG: UDP-2,3-diacylglucosamine diphosphatase [Gammaproteobacteria bacterium]|nr:UDP-2,3-diacylglucosamine diphosphatase [Gammaproteobacteria bacterium]